MHSLNIYGVYSYNRNSFSGDVRCLAVSPVAGYIQGSKPKLIARDLSKQDVAQSVISP